MRSIRLVAFVWVMMLPLLAHAESDAFVFDPASNVRAEKNDSSRIVCEIKTKRSIKTYEKSGNWYRTDACGPRGWIHNSQIRIYKAAQAVKSTIEVKASPASSATVLCKASGGLRVMKTQSSYYQTDYCGALGWVRVADVTLANHPPTTAALKLMTASAPSCSGDSQCTEAGVLPACADVGRAKCIDGKCHFDPTLDSNCPCYAGQVRECTSASQQFNYCSGTAANSAAWDSTCGPSQGSCPLSRVECPTGTMTTVYDFTKRSWQPGTCVVPASCPKDGEKRECPSSKPGCPTGLQTYASATGWGECVVPNCATPPPPAERTYTVVPDAGPFIAVRRKQCQLGLIKNARWRVPGVRDNESNQLTVLDRAGVLALDLANGIFKDAVVRITFDGTYITDYSFVSVTFQGTTTEAAWGYPRVKNNTMVLERPGHPDLGLVMSPGQPALLPAGLRRCGKTLVRGQYQGPTSFKVTQILTYEDDPIQP